MQRFKRRRVRLDDVDVVPPGLRFGEYALQNLVGCGAPQIDLHPVLLLESAVKRCHVLHRQRRIEIERCAFAARALRQARRPIRTFVLRDIGREGGADERRAEQHAQRFHRPYLSSWYRYGLSTRQISRVTCVCGNLSPHSRAISAMIAMSSSAQAMVCVPHLASASFAALEIPSARRSASTSSPWHCASASAS